MTYNEIYQAYLAWGKNLKMPVSDLIERGPIAIEDLADDVTVAYYAVGCCDGGLRLFVFYEKCVWRLNKDGDRMEVLCEEYGIGARAPGLTGER